MGRVLHIRIHGLPADQLAGLHDHWATLTATREWRGEAPWLADTHSRDLFSMEYFRHVFNECRDEHPDLAPLSAATFVRLGGDETDALGLLFILRDLSERFATHIALRDPDNPIAKLRAIDLRSGLLPDGSPLETILVKRPIFKKLPDGSRIEMYPPRALNFAFGREEDGEAGDRAWSFLVHGMRGSKPTFFEAEAEALRIYRGLRFLP